MLVFKISVVSQVIYLPIVISIFFLKYINVGVL